MQKWQVSFEFSVCLDSRLNSDCSYFNLSFLWFTQHCFTSETEVRAFPEHSAHFLSFISLVMNNMWFIKCRFLTSASARFSRIALPLHLLLYNNTSFLTLSLSMRFSDMYYIVYSLFCHLTVHSATLYLMLVTENLNFNTVKQSFLFMPAQWSSASMQQIRSLHFQLSVKLRWCSLNLINF